MHNWQSKENLKNLLKQLVSFPSVTGSKDEMAISEYIHFRLSELDFFKSQPHMLELHPTEDGRKVVSALVKQKTNVKKTVILLSHFDVVDIEDYGEWKNIAFRTEELTAMFQQNKEKMSKEVQKDLVKGDWIFGRGTMDMKAGLSLHMSLIEEACFDGFDGNLLLITVPDEEVNSVGMRAAVDILLELALKHDLEYMACLNSEPMFTRYPGDKNFYIYSGSMGKILPGFFCYGKETHVGEPFAGLNANAMASEITRLLELNTDFCEVVEGEVTPPPTNLMQKDLKEGYSVQIPHTAVTLFNVMLMERPLEILNQQLIEIGEKAARNIEKSWNEKAKAFSHWVTFHPDPLQIKVMTYETLRQEAICRFGESDINRREAYIIRQNFELGDRDLSKMLVNELTALCKDLAPMMILYYSPPYYPAISSRHSTKVVEVIHEVKNYAQTQNGISFIDQHYFPGISDLSFLSLQQTTASLYSLIGNMPLYGQRYDLPFDALKALNVPVLNLGPLGRDAHKWTERLNVDYSFGELRELLTFLIKKLFK